MATDAPLPATAAEALTVWIALKDQLRRRMTAAEWDLCIRPARLWTLMGGCCLLIALPRNGLICFKYLALQGVIRNKLAKIYGPYGLGAVATNDPSEFDRSRLVEDSSFRLEFMEQWEPMERCPQCGWFCDRLGKWPAQCRACGHILKKKSTTETRRRGA